MCVCVWEVGIKADFGVDLEWTGGEVDGRWTGWDGIRWL